VIKALIIAMCMLHPRAFGATGPDLSEVTYSTAKPWKVGSRDPHCAEDGPLKSEKNDIGFWQERRRLKCLLEVPRASTDKKYRAIFAAEKQLEVQGPWQKGLQEAWAALSLSTLLELAAKDRGKAWKLVVPLTDRASYLSEREKVDLFKTAGEMAVLDGKKTLALDYFGKSLALRETSSVRTQWQRLRQELGLSPLPPTGPIEGAGTVIEASEEAELFDRFQINYQSRDFVAAAEDGARFLRKWPGSVRGPDVRGKCRALWLSVAGTSDGKLYLMRDAIMTGLAAADSVSLSEWVKASYDREAYSDTIEMARLGLDAYDALSPVRMHLALSHYHLGQFSDALKNLERLKKASELSVRAEAFFRIGLLKVRQGQQLEAMNAFQSAVDLTEQKTFRVQALYWGWRCAQKLKHESTEARRLKLIDEFPLSYYGLRARLESSGGVLDFPMEPKTFSLKLRLTPKEKSSWERLRVLLAYGWFEEARLEIAELPEPQDSEGLLVMAHIAMLVGQAGRANEFASHAWLLSRATLTWPALGIVYPKLFSEPVISHSKKLSGPNIIWSLIRQESQFDPRARSPMGAVGLMQLLPSTSEEIAKDLNMKNFNSAKDLETPDRNIKIGSTYLLRLIKSFSGHVPMALAAYNCGMGNLRTWLKFRPDLRLESMASAEPETELWFDELPWLETSGYVRNILRNLIIYETLSDPQTKVMFPHWKLSP
jgi:soluble lytic murein transglycosylase